MVFPPFFNPSGKFIPSFMKLKWERSMNAINFIDIEKKTFFLTSQLSPLLFPNCKRNRLTVVCPKYCCGIPVDRWWNCGVYFNLLAYTDGCRAFDLSKEAGYFNTYDSGSKSKQLLGNWFYALMVKYYGNFKSLVSKHLTWIIALISRGGNQAYTHNNKLRLHILDSWNPKHPCNIVIYRKFMMDIAWNQKKSD